MNCLLLFELFYSLFLYILLIMFSAKIDKIQRIKGKNSQKVLIGPFCIKISSPTAKYIIISKIIKIATAQQRSMMRIAFLLIKSPPNSFCFCYFVK